MSEKRNTSLVKLEKSKSKEAKPIQNDDSDDYTSNEESDVSPHPPSIPRQSKAKIIELTENIQPEDASRRRARRGRSRRSRRRGSRSRRRRSRSRRR